MVLDAPIHGSPSQVAARTAERDALQRSSDSLAATGKELEALRSAAGEVHPFWGDGRVEECPGYLVRF